MLTFKDYSKLYGTRKILEIKDCSINFNLSWIRGINGSGKTTLLKSVAGLIPFHGEIMLDGLNLRKDPVRFRRMVTYSEAEPEFPSFLTGDELIGYTARARKVAQKDVDDLRDYLGINLYSHSPCGGYSTGMIKKISLCMAFLGKPGLILLDEPLAFIDQETSERLTDLINNRIRQKTRFILTSHQNPGTEHLSPEAAYQIMDHTLRRLS
jgi:ABC-2 type transport system ATP-binding protein